MKFAAISLLAAAGSAAAFAPTLSSTRQSTSLSMADGKEMSQALPFLPRPKLLDGSLAGDVGFDPFGFGGGDKATLIRRQTDRKKVLHDRIATGNALSNSTGGQWGDGKNIVDDDDKELDAVHHRSRSLQRKASMKRRLETGHSLADTHGNTWPYSESVENEESQRDKAMHRAEMWGQRQTSRKKVLQDRIETGKALSDATGGHWNDGDGGEKQ